MDMAMMVAARAEVVKAAVAAEAGAVGKAACRVVMRVAAGARARPS